MVKRLRIVESDDKITARSFQELISKLEDHGYSCEHYYDMRYPESNWLYITKNGDPYEAEFYRYSDGEYELYLHNIHPTKEKNEGCYRRKTKKKRLKKEDSYGYVHDEDEAKLPQGIQSYLKHTGWVPMNIDGKKYYLMDFNYGNVFCDIYIDEWGNCYLVTDNDDLRPSDMFYTITETNTNVIDDLITLGNTITSTGDIDSALSVFFG